MLVRAGVSLLGVIILLSEDERMFPQSDLA